MSKVTADGQHFFDRVKLHLSPLFERFGFKEVDRTDNYNFTGLTVKNDAVALRVTFEKRDNRVDVAISRLVDSKVPPIMIFAPKTVDDVTEIQLWMVLWVDGWERSRAGSLGDFDLYEPDLLDKAVRDTAHALEEHASEIMRGDLEAWNRVAFRVVHRNMPR